MCFSVIEGNYKDKVENAGQKSATADGMKALITSIYAVPNISKGWEYDSK